MQSSSRKSACTCTFGRCEKSRLTEFHTQVYWPSWPRLSFLSPQVWLMKAAGHRKCAEKCKWAFELLRSPWTRKFSACRTPATCNNFPLRSRGWLYFFARWFIFFVLHYNILCWRLGMSREKNRLVLRPVHKFSPGRLFFCRARLCVRGGHKSLGNEALFAVEMHLAESVWRRRAFCAKIIWEKWDINYSEWHNASTVVH